ncbi:MAG: hypothetical protein FIB06_01600 [Betaproteobacteria bacterium]|nr:hypothetical protein [Betaproteobacteria bacterium]
MRIYFDIETAPDMRLGAREAIRAQLKAPANYKKPESIAQWLAEEGEAAADTAWRKTALDASAGELISIAWCTDDDGDAQSVIRAPGDDERTVLAGFFNQVQQLLEAGAIRDHRGDLVYDDAPFFVAHNAAFDLGFLWRRSIVLGVRPPFRIPGPCAREGKDFACTMRTWAGPRDTIGLDRLCRALGIASPKGDLDGSKVYDAWQAGELERIAEYNRRDALAVRDIWHRLNWEAAA